MIPSAASAASAASAPASEGAAEEPVHWWWAIPLLLFVAGRCLVPMDETDLFYNLRLGEIILTTHAVPRTNLLSFTYPDYTDPNLAWVFQILLALVHRAGGIEATVLLKTAFVVMTFALLFRVAILRGAHPALASAALALAAWTAEPRFVERPHLVTFLGLAVLLIALERWERGKRGMLWALVPIGLVWANANSCFFLAPAVLLLYAVGARLDGTKTPGGVPVWSRVALVGVALIPLLFATPSGSGFIGYVANHFRMPFLRPLQEYRTATWPTDGPFLFLLIAMALVTVLPIGNRQHVGGGGGGFTRQLLPILALAIVGSRRIRFVAEFALLAGPFVAARGTQILREALARWPRATRAGSSLIVAGLIALTLGPRAVAACGAAAVLDIGMQDGLVPTTAIRWVDAQGLRQRMYNDLEVGSYLTWDGWPRARVFQDPRINGYPDDLHAILRRQDLPRAEWEALLARFGTTSALITFPELNPRAALFDPASWALVYRTNDALVFVRRGPAHAALIEADELPLTFRFEPATGVAPVPISQPPVASHVKACEWGRRLGDWYASTGEPVRAAAQYQRALDADAGCLTPSHRDAARQQAAILALRSGDPARAADLLAGLTSPTARTNRGFALVQLGRPDKGLAEFEASLRQEPGQPETTFGRALALARLDRHADADRALRAFLDRWPQHFAAPQARQLLARLPRREPVFRPR